MKAQFFMALIMSITAVTPSTAQTTPNFGDDTSEFAQDGECDDPRFTGVGGATSTTIENVGKDASDCTRLYNLGEIRLNRTKDQSSISECKAISFGDDSSEWAKDNECDDPRFTGSGMADVLNPADLGRDAQDCSALCNSGSIWVR